MSHTHIWESPFYKFVPLLLHKTNYSIFSISSSHCKTSLPLLHSWDYKLYYIYNVCVSIMYNVNFVSALLLFCPLFFLFYLLPLFLHLLSPESCFSPSSFFSCFFFISFFRFCFYFLSSLLFFSCWFRLLQNILMSLLLLRPLLCLLSFLIPFLFLLFFRLCFLPFFLFFSCLFFFFLYSSYLFFSLAHFTSLFFAFASASYPCSSFSTADSLLLQDLLLLFFASASST